jgi:hypothetical protein
MRASLVGDWFRILFRAKRTGCIKCEGVRTASPTYWAMSTGNPPRPARKSRTRNAQSMNVDVDVYRSAFRRRRMIIHEVP